MGRWFYKCPICLSVVAIDGRPIQGLQCSLCNRQMTVMGKVQGQHLVRKELLTPCDARCTGAEGPSCNCQCGGKNHGTKALVEMVFDAGGIPKVRPPDAAATKRREEFLAAREEASQRIEALLGKPLVEAYKKGTWIDDREKWEDAHYVIGEYHAATALKSQKGRLKALAKVAAPRLSR